jgi:hypothetical protein
MLAETLFRQGKTEMEAGHYEQACADLAESQRLDPAGGTELTLALCYERAEKFGSAWVEFLEAIAFAKRDGRADREKIARAHAAAMEAAAPRLVVQVDPATGNTTVSVALDGTALSPSAWSAGVPADPGLHSLEASAPGRRSWSTTVTLVRGTRTEVTVPPLQALDAEPNATRTPAEPTKTIPPAPVSVAPRNEKNRAGPGAPTGSARRTVAYAVGGAGLAAVLTGAVFGIHAWSLSGEICDGSTCPESQRDTYNEFQTAATVANVAVGIGLVCVGVSIILLVTDHSPKDVPARASARASSHDFVLSF